MHVPNQVGVRYDVNVELGPANDRFTCKNAVLGRNDTCGFPRAELDRLVVGGHRRSPFGLQPGKDRHHSEVGGQSVSQPVGSHELADDSPN